MNLVGSLQILGDYSLKSAHEEDLAVYDSLAEVAEQLASSLTFREEEQKRALQTIASKAREIADGIRVNEQRQLDFQQFLNPGGEQP